MRAAQRGEALAGASVPHTGEWRGAGVWCGRLSGGSVDAVGVEREAKQLCRVSREEALAAATNVEDHAHGGGGEDGLATRRPVDVAAAVVASHSVGPLKAEAVGGRVPTVERLAPLRERMRLAQVGQRPRRVGGGRGRGGRHGREGAQLAFEIRVELRLVRLGHRRRLGPRLVGGLVVHVPPLQDGPVVRRARQQPLVLG